MALSSNDKNENIGTKKRNKIETVARYLLLIGFSMRNTTADINTINVGLQLR